MINALLNTKELTRKTKITVYKTIYQFTLTFGRELWLLTNNQSALHGDGVSMMSVRSYQKIEEMPF